MELRQGEGEGTERGGEVSKEDSQGPDTEGIYRMSREACVLTNVRYPEVF